jgi:hypothetical protein
VSWLAALTWLDPGTLHYHDIHYGLWQWEPPSWILQCIMARPANLKHQKAENA